MKASGTYAYLNFAASALVLTVATAFIGLLIYRTSFQKQNAVEARLLKAGETFTGLQEINFSKSRNTVLLALDTKCSYCDLSIPFYKRLIANISQSPGTRVIALFNNGRIEAEDYVKKHDLDVEFMTKADLVMTKVDLTPTVVLVDTNRIIMASYEGMLPEKQEQDLIKALERNTSAE